MSEMQAACITEVKRLAKHQATHGQVNGANRAWHITGNFCKDTCQSCEDCGEGSKPKAFEPICI